MKLVAFNFSINTAWDRFKHLGCISTTITKHKAVELEHYYYSGTLFEVGFDLGIREDHSGMNITVCLVGYNVHFQFYDTRHWDYDTNTRKAHNE
jgi:hypothetical protein